MQYPDLIQTPEFWLENLRNQLFNILQNYMDENNLTQQDLADKFGWSKGYISQVLHGNSDHRISKLVQMALTVGKVPYVYFKDLSEVVELEKNNKSVHLDFEKMELNAAKVENLEEVYEAMSQDRERESEALEWIEGVLDSKK